MNSPVLFVEAEPPCASADWGSGFPICHLWTQPFKREKRPWIRVYRSAHLIFAVLCTGKWLGLFSAVCRLTMLQSCWDETEGADAFLHPYTLHSPASHLPILFTIPYSLPLILLTPFLPSTIPLFSLPIFSPLALAALNLSLLHLLASGKLSRPCHWAEGATVLPGKSDV